ALSGSGVSIVFNGCVVRRNTAPSGHGGSRPTAARPAVGGSRPRHRGRRRRAGTLSTCLCHAVHPWRARRFPAAVGGRCGAASAVARRGDGGGGGADGGRPAARSAG